MTVLADSQIFIKIVYYLNIARLRSYYSLYYFFYFLFIIYYLLLLLFAQA